MNSFLFYSWHIAKLVSEQSKPKKRTAISSRFRQPVRPPNLPPQRTAYSGSSSFRSPAKTIFPQRYNNVSNTPRNTPVHQRSQTTTMEFSFDQLKSQQTVNNYGQNQFANDASNRSPPLDKILSTEKNNEMNNSIQPKMNQSVDLRNRINEIRENQSIIDLTLDDSDESKISRNHTTAYQHNNQFAKKSPPIAPKSESFVSYQQSTQSISAPTSAKTPSYIQSPILTNNPFFDVSLPPPIVRMQPTPIIRMQDRLKNQQKIDSHSIVNKNIGEKSVGKSVNDRLVTARQTLPVIDLTKQTSNFSVVNVSRKFELRKAN